MIRVGFTGTRRWMTHAQRAPLRYDRHMLIRLTPKEVSDAPT